MENLAQIPAIRDKIRIASRTAILALYKLIFQEEGGRTNRRRLREFTGFEFIDDSDEFRAKMEFCNTFTVGDLTSICNILGLDYQGSKEELRRRIICALMDINSLVNYENTDDAESDQEQDGNQNNIEVDQSASDEESDGSQRSVAHREYRPTDKDKVKFALNFKDVEDSIRSFDGSDNYSVERWINDFEEVAVLFEWSDIQKLIFAKKSLKGLAKTFIQSERIIKTWKKLKDALKEEFSSKVSSVELHRMLSEKRIGKNETVQEYYLAMRELASRGSIETESVIQYIIDGIYDDDSNKLLLYGARSYADFKDRLRTYEKFKRATQGRKVVKSKESTRWEDTSRKPIRDQSSMKPFNKDVRCFNCGETGHRSNTCKHKGLGKKCFKCNKFGHEAANCFGEKFVKDSKVTTHVIDISPTNSMFKEIVIGDTKINALVDTGSQVSLLREDVYKKLNIENLICSTTTLTGFGKSAVRSIGYVQTTILIDDQDFPFTFHIVPHDSMNMPAVIGCDFASQAEMTINNEGITIKKIEPKIFLARIDLPINETETNVDLISDNIVKETIENMITSYAPKESKCTDIELHIVVKDDAPIFQTPRRLPVVEREIVEQQVNDWLHKGIIEPCASEYASPVVVTKKKDGSPRVCIDYRKINKVIVKDRYPLPVIEDQIDALVNIKIFSTIDLKNGFFHVSVTKESRKYTSFVTHNGQFQFLKAPFGLCNSPAVFQRFINHVFRQLVNEGIVILYLDDIIILASDVHEGIKRLELVLEVASQYGLEINKKKCNFMKERITFLGYIIEKGNVYPSPEKIESVMRFPEPKTVKNVQSYLGLTGYFRKFIVNYSIIAKPLSDLLQKDKPFQFNDKEKNAFNTLKSILSKDPVLKIYNPELETELHTDASQDGYGAILLQKDCQDNKFHPVYYMSFKTSQAERNYKSYELEVLAVIRALEKFRVYLLGKTFKIVTDCVAFKQTMDKKELNPKFARWAMMLQDYDCTIEHRSGLRMKHVDALSRNSIMMISENDMVIRIKGAQKADSELKVIIEILKDKPYDDYFLRNEMLYKYKQGNELLVVPKAMQNEIIQKAHDKGHFAIKRTEENIKNDYFIPNLKEKVEKFISNCISCILANRKEGKLESLLYPLPKLDLPLHTYHIDHLGPLESTSKNYNHILAIVDSFTKFIWLYPSKSTTTKEVISKLDLQKSIFGNPANIISDRGTAFSSKDFQDYCMNENIKHSMITTGLPRANGQIERMNRTIIPVLTKLSLDNPTKWYQHVTKVQRALNSTFVRSIKMTPFELLTGVKMRQKEDLRLKELLESEFQYQFEQNRDQMRQQAKEEILKVQAENRKTYNLRRRKPSTYKLGDLVAIKRVQMSPGRKLRARYLGPYKIERVKFNDTYDVKRIGVGEGPNATSTCAEYMKPWASSNQSIEAND